MQYALEDLLTPSTRSEFWQYVIQARQMRDARTCRLQSPIHGIVMQSPSEEPTQLPALGIPHLSSNSIRVIIPYPSEITLIAVHAHSGVIVHNSGTSLLNISDNVAVYDGVTAARGRCTDTGIAQTGEVPDLPVVSESQAEFLRLQPCLQPVGDSVTRADDGGGVVQGCVLACDGWLP